MTTKGTTCSRMRCKHPARYLGLCMSHATKEADRLFSLYVLNRDGWCLACGSPEAGQCAHIISRRYRATRWDILNAVRLCQSCHVRYTHQPEEWREWADEHGFVPLDVLHDQALNHPVPDLGEVLSELRGMAKA